MKVLTNSVPTLTIINRIKLFIFIISIFYRTSIYIDGYKILQKCLIYTRQRENKKKVSEPRRLFFMHVFDEDDETLPAKNFHPKPEFHEYDENFSSQNASEGSVFKDASSDALVLKTDYYECTIQESMSQKKSSESDDCDKSSRTLLLDSGNIDELSTEAFSLDTLPHPPDDYDDEDEYEDITDFTEDTGALDLLSHAENNKNKDFFTDDEDDVEDDEDYKNGGYHPTSVGDCFNDRYAIIKKLGWGHFSTVWLCYDFCAHRMVALKIVKSAQHYTEAAEDEILLLDKVSSVAFSSTTEANNSGSQCLDRNVPVVRLLENFRHRGEHGIHVCMVFEVLGENLLKLIRRFDHRGLPIPLVKKIARQILAGLEILHVKCGIIHTDLKPENVLILMQPSEIRALAIAAIEHAIADGASHLEKPNFSESEKKREYLDHEMITSKLKKRNRHRGTFRDHLDRSQSITDSQQSLQKMGELLTLISSQNDLEKSMQSIKISPKDNSPLKLQTTSKNRLAGSKLVKNDELGRSQLVVALDDIRVKIADLGNACWVDKHFTNDIQTRQYRSPEVILGIPYDSGCDIWSLACLLFELATGDFLFSPHSGKRYCKDEDHIAQIIELLGRMPKTYALSGKYSREVFTKHGDLRHIRDLEFWRLPDVLVEKYAFSEKDASEFSAFLLPMLEYSSKRRATAADCLNHPWLSC